MGGHCLSFLRVLVDQKRFRVDFPPFDGIRTLRLTNAEGLGRARMVAWRGLQKLGV